MDNVFVGQIELLPYTFEPMGMARCDGRLLPINQYQTLFSLLGNRYGGDGINNFALPNLQGTEPVPHTNFCIALDGIYPTRS